MNAPPPLPEDLLSGYADGELRADERAAVEGRLAESADWRGALDDVLAARDAVRALPIRDAPDGRWAWIHAAVAAADTAAADSPPAAPPVVDLFGRRVARIRRTRVWAAVGGAVAAAAAGAVLLVPAHEQARPDLATFSDAHVVQASVADDPLAHLAAFGAFARPR